MLNSHSRVGTFKVLRTHTNPPQCGRYSILHNELCTWETTQGPGVAQSTATGKKGE